MPASRRLDFCAVTFAPCVVALQAMIHSHNMHLSTCTDGASSNHGQIMIMSTLPSLSSSNKSDVAHLRATDKMTHFCKHNQPYRLVQDMPHQALCHALGACKCTFCRPAEVGTPGLLPTKTAVGRSALGSFTLRPFGRLCFLSFLGCVLSLACMHAMQNLAT